MTDTPEQLVRDMQAYYEAWTDDADVDLASAFGERIKHVGAQVLLVHLFRHYADARLSNWLRMLSFVWTPLSYAVWLRILDDLSGDRRWLYQFLWFAGEHLALDLHRLDVAHPNVRAELRGETFRSGGPSVISRHRRAHGDGSLDYESMWRRLAQEGAPVRQSVMKN